MKFKLSEEGYAMLFSGIMLAVIFGLMVGAVIIGVAEQNKIAILVGSGIYIENKGGGEYLIRNGNSTTGRGIGTLYSNIPMTLPIGICYQLFLNQTAPRSFTIDIKQSSVADCR